MILSEFVSRSSFVMWQRVRARHPNCHVTGALITVYGQQRAGNVVLRNNGVDEDGRSEYEVEGMTFDLFILIFYFKKRRVWLIMKTGWQLWQSNHTPSRTVGVVARNSKLQREIKDTQRFSTGGPGNYYQKDNLKRAKNVLVAEELVHFRSTWT